jgi:hypothetical protein
MKLDELTDHPSSPTSGKVMPSSRPLQKLKGPSESFDKRGDKGDRAQSFETESQSRNPGVTRQRVLQRPASITPLSHGGRA